MQIKQWEGSLGRLGSYRKDLQWLSGLFFINCLMVTLLLGGVTRLLAPESAKPALKSLFQKGLLQSKAIKSYSQTIKDLKALPPNAYFRLPGTPKAGITAGEAVKLNAKSFAAKIADDLAFRVYEGGLSAFEPQDQALIGPLSKINRNTYNGLADFGRSARRAAIFFGLSFFIFGRRYGRLFGLGLAIMIATILPMTIFQLAVTTISESLKDPKAVLDIPLYTGLKPHLEEGLRFLQKFFYLALILMASAALGRITYRLTARWRKPDEAEADTQNKAGKLGRLHFIKTLELQIPYEKAFGLCSASLDRVDAGIKKKDETTGNIGASTWSLGKFLLKGIGENIGFVLQAIDENNTRIEISSKPSLRTVLFDMGRNKGNVESLSNFLEKEELKYLLSQQKNAAKSKAKKDALSAAPTKLET